MGIYGALSTAVTGLRAQSFALENISGNIANSQTTGFKRIDTDFLDLIPDQPRKLQTAGSVLAQSRSTNTAQGDVKSVSNPTYMAVNGAGFFVVEPSLGQSDGNSLFAGTNYYTRRGDFDINDGGYLVNGSGYFLKGMPIDPATGNISSSLPQVLRISSNFLPAQPTSRINYQLNLPEIPLTAVYKDSGAPGSELLDRADFTAPTNPATLTGATVGSQGLNDWFPTTGSITVKVGDSGTPKTFTFSASGTTSGTAISLADTSTDDLDKVLAYIANEVGGMSLSASSGKIVAASTSVDDSLTITGTNGLGLPTGTANATVAPTTRIDHITAAQSADFISQTIGGGTITVYNATGAPADVQLRWAKIDSVASGGSDTWNLYYMENGAATGTANMWTRVPQDFTFVSGALSPAVTESTFPTVVIDGVTMTNLRLDYGTDGIAQYNDPNGTVGVSALSQNGYPTGKFSSVAINDNGRVVVSYSNNQQVEVAQVITANFNAANQLKRLDGGIFAETSDSGSAIFDTSGGVASSSLESSNTDISEEFTKLIVTQQAYAAGTRIVSTADQMLQEALNMVR